MHGPMGYNPGIKRFDRLNSDIPKNLGGKMVQMFQQTMANKKTSRWLPAILAVTVALYFIGYVDGTVQGSLLGGNMAIVHEVFHHARHVALMCH